MNKEEYNVMFNIEDDYWWYVGLRNLVLSSINSVYCNASGLTMLDAGCGTGKTLETLREQAIYGIDYSPYAIGFCKQRELNNVTRSSICSVPFKNNSFDVVISLDVLYHLGVDNDVAALRELCNAMKEGGIILLNLPAYNFLRSRHDDVIHTKRRYTIKVLKKKMEKAGFVVKKITYRNTFLSPVAFIKRLADKILASRSSIEESDLRPLPAFLNKLLTQLLLFENRLILSGVTFPFGLSVFCVGKKRASF